MSKYFWLTAIFTGLFYLCASAKLPSPDKIIQNFEETIEKANTFKAEFTETYKWELTGEQQTMHGRFFLKGEDRFRIVTEDQVIVSDGQTIWMYNIPSERVLIDDLHNSEDTMLPRQVLLKHQDQYRSQVLEEERLHNQPCYVMLLTAEQENTFIPKVKIWIHKDQWTPQKIEQTDLNQNVTTYVLKNVELGVPMEEALFHFKMPENADVVDMRQ